MPQVNYNLLQILNEHIIKTREKGYREIRMEILAISFQLSAMSSQLLNQINKKLWTISFRLLIQTKRAFPLKTYNKFAKLQLRSFLEISNKTPIQFQIIIKLIIKTYGNFQMQPVINSKILNKTPITIPIMEILLKMDFIIL